MKRSLLLIALFALATCTYAQSTGDTKTIATDTIKSKKKTVSITIASSDNGMVMKKDSVKYRKTPGGFFSLTFTRFDLGFSKLVDNGSFTLTAPNKFLDYRSGKTSNVGFDILQLGYRFNSNFRMYVAGGFDWTHIRLENNITIRQDAPTLAFDVQPVDLDKNRFSSTYIRIPVGFDFRSKNDKKGKSFHVIVGPEGGFLLGGKVKQVSDENGKQKIKDDYHFTEFRYGAYGRIGYGGAGIFYKQYFNNMFENSPAQDGLKNIAFGVSFGF